MAELQVVFDGLCGVLRKHARGMTLVDALPGSQAKEKKPTLVMLGKKPVTIGKREIERMYVAGVILQKIYVGFYFMPVYCAPKEFKLTPALMRMKKGKACFHVKSLDAGTKAELDALLGQGVSCFKKRGWV